MKQRPYTVIVVTVQRGGQHIGSVDLASDDFNLMRQRAESLTEGFMDRCEPRRAYVLGRDGVPCYAGGRPRMSAMAGLRSAA